MLTPSNTIHCGSCGRNFPWKAEFAGRKAKCPCGQVMVYPVSPPPVEAALTADPESDYGQYDLAPDPPRAQPAGALTELASSDAAPAAPVASVLSYRSAASRSNPADLDTEKLTKQTVPLWILSGGLIVEGGIALLRGREDPTLAVMHLIFRVGVGSVLMIVGVLIAARVREIQVGSLGSALLRLAAVSVGTGAVADLLIPFALFIPFGGLAVHIVNFALYFALLGMFFDLDESDTWYCVCVIFLINLAVYFSILALFHS